MQNAPIKNEHPYVIDLLMKDISTDNEFKHNNESIILGKAFEIAFLLKMYKDQVTNTDEAVKGLINDLQERVEIGVSRYGTALQPFNGRSSVVDLYEELLDALFYARSNYYEKHGE